MCHVLSPLRPTSTDLRSCLQFYCCTTHFRQILLLSTWLGPSLDSLQPAWHIKSIKYFKRNVFLRGTTTKAIAKAKAKTKNGGEKKVFNYNIIKIDKLSVANMARTCGDRQGLTLFTPPPPTEPGRWLCRQKLLFIFTANEIRVRHMSPRIKHEWPQNHHQGVEAKCWKLSSVCVCILHRDRVRLHL